jgi:hypothetical protein
MQNGTSNFGATWCAGDRLLGKQYWVCKKVPNQPDRFDVRAVFKDSYVIQLLSNGYVGAVRKFESPYPTDYVCIEIGNLAIEKIVLRDLTKEDDVNGNCDPERQIKKMMLTPVLFEHGYQENYDFDSTDTVQPKTEGANK